MSRLSHTNASGLLSRSHSGYEVVADDEEHDEEGDDVAHEFPVVLARTDHVLDTTHAAAQQPLGTVEVITLKGRTQQSNVEFAPKSHPHSTISQNHGRHCLDTHASFLQVFSAKFYSSHENTPALCAVPVAIARSLNMPRESPPDVRNRFRIWDRENPRVREICCICELTIPSKYVLCSLVSLSMSKASCNWKGEQIARAAFWTVSIVQIQFTPHRDCEL